MRKITQFTTAEDKPLTQKEYIFLINYKLHTPDEDINLYFHTAGKSNHYSYLAAYAGIPSFVVLNPKTFATVIDETTITDDLLGYPFLNLAEYVSRGLSLTSKVLDLGCGNKAISNQFQAGLITTVDAFPKFNPDIMWNLNDLPLPFKDNEFELVLLLDVIEHLDKEAGKKLLEDIKRITKRVFVFTPTIWTDNVVETENPNSEYYQDEFNLHRSLWTPEEFTDFVRVYNPLVEKYFFGYWEKK